MQLSKTNFLHYLDCSKSLWLLKHKPSLFPPKKISTYEDKLAKEGYDVQKLVQNYMSQRTDSFSYTYEKTYKTEAGLYASADIIRQNDDGTVNIYEVKSSGGIDKTHLVDATFQTITVEKTGVSVRSVYIVHLNKNYIREDAIQVEEMMSFSLVTNQVRDMTREINVHIDAAFSLLSQNRIDETKCSCLELSKSHHCESFDYFNCNIPKPSIYNLPRIHKKKLKTFVSEGRFNLAEIDETEVSANQLNVLVAAKLGTPVINRCIIREFYNQVQYPVYFLDYETYSSAIPFVKGVKPHAHIPFQFSIHKIATKYSANSQHFEYLATRAELPINMISSMENIIGSTGSIVSWHKSFENTRNKEMSALYPNKATFLNTISERTIDLEDIFKGGYVDIAFGGSTSIKKVLPIIVPKLNYDDLEVANGTDAMEAFNRMLTIPEGVNKEKLRREMLEYCKLDTLAMVKIFKKMAQYI